VPAFITVALLVLCVHEHARVAQRADATPVADVKRLSRRYWLVALLGANTLARFSEAFLVLRKTSDRVRLRAADGR
jgi:hypothetical protein